ILLTNSEGEEEQKVKIGHIHAFTVNYSDGDPGLFYVLDGESGALEEMYSHLFDRNDGMPKEDIVEQWTGNAMLIERLEIEPKFRGNDYGLHAIRQLIDTFGASCEPIVMKPFPLQHATEDR